MTGPVIIRFRLVGVCSPLVTEVDTGTISKVPVETETEGRFEVVNRGLAEVHRRDVVEVGLRLRDGVRRVVDDVAVFRTERFEAEDTHEVEGRRAYLG